MHYGLFTEWYSNGQKMMQENWKDSAEDQYGQKLRQLEGLSTWWYENGQKLQEGNYKGGKLMTVVAWKPSGEKCPDTKIDEDGNGVLVCYNEDGTETLRWTYEDGEEIYSQEFGSADINVVEKFRHQD